MPIYEVEDPTTGKTLELEGDSPPTEAELEDIFSSFQQEGAQGQESKGFMESVFPSTTETFRNPQAGPIGSFAPRAALGVLSDVSSIPQRALAAATTDQKFSTPGAYLGKESADRSGQEAEMRRESFREIPGENPQETYRRMQADRVSGVGEEVAAPIREVAGQAIADPLILSGVARGAASGVAKAGETMMDMGKNVLRRAVKPSRPSMRAWNPPDFEVPLREKLVTKFGGLEKAGQNVQGAVEKTAEAKDALLRASKIRVSGSGAIQQARRDVLANVGRGKGLSATEAKDVPRYMEEAFETAKSYPSFRGDKSGWGLSGQDAVEFRKWIDRQTSFDRTKDLPAKGEFYRSLRKSFEEQVDTRIASKPQGAQYLKEKSALKDLVPVQKALEERLLQDPNNYAIGLRETALLGGAVASGNLGAATAKAGIGVAINRLLNRPGGAAILYQLGNNLAEPGPMKTLLLYAADAGELTANANRILNALAITNDDRKKAVLEKKLMEELGSSFEAKK